VSHDDNRREDGKPVAADDPAAPTGSAPWRDAVVAATVEWVEKAVIGLGLCPFARPVHVQKRIRFAVTTARDIDRLADVLQTELETLAESPPETIETTLLVHPLALQDFLAFNDFLEVADEIVEEMGLAGVLQVASFHPDYQFEGSAADDIENYTNRSPYPTLHLLREESIERAVAAHPDTEQIFRTNIETLKRLGHEGWSRLGLGAGRKYPTS
jgi:hypothetical protein